jgi:hypothetical protein
MVGDVEEVLAALVQVLPVVLVAAVGDFLELQQLPVLVILHQEVHLKEIVVELDVQTALSLLLVLDILEQVEVVVEQLVEMQVLVLLDLEGLGIQSPNLLHH